MAGLFNTPLAELPEVSALSDRPTSLAAAVLTDDNRLIVIVIAAVARRRTDRRPGCWYARCWRPARAPTA